MPSRRSSVGSCGGVRPPPGSRREARLRGSPRMTEPIIAVDRVGKVFDLGGATTHAIEDISLAVMPGEFISIIGPSGCGKSTLLRIVGDLVEPSSGTVTVKGKTPHQA